MPINEDDYEQRQQQHVMSKAEQRRSNKPIMEKRRRARINHCLNELKTLILDAMKKDPSRHSKLEKADILEMTVKHLQSVQRQQLAIAVATDPTVLHKFKMGFSECANEVSRYVGRMDGVEPAVKQRLASHLTNCVTALQHLSPFAFGGMGTGVLGGLFPSMSPSATSPPNSLHVPVQPTQGNPQAPSNGDVNNNQSNRFNLTGGLQLIPSRLPTGELALLVPNSQLPFFHPPTTQTTTVNNAASTFVTRGATVPSSTVTSGAIHGTHPSAFTAVTRSLSPPRNSTQDNFQRLEQTEIHSTTNLIRHQIPSPAFSSSSEDEDEDEGESESYSSPRSPPITNNYPPQLNVIRNGYSSNQSQHSAFQTVREKPCFKVPFTATTAAFKPFHQQQTDDKKPHQQLLVTSSTCVESPASGNSTKTSTTNIDLYTEVKFEMKTVPESQNTSHSISASKISNTTDSIHSILPSTPLHLPLSIVTDSHQNLNIQSPPNSNHINRFGDPLDFSVKKDDTVGNFSSQQIYSCGNKRQIPSSYNEPSSSAAPYQSSAVSPTFLSPQKIPRLSVNIVAKTGFQQNVHEAVGSFNGGPLLKCSDTVRQLSNIPGTSTATIAEADTSGAKDSMWRPW